MLIVFRDIDTGKVSHFSSGGHGSGREHFTIKDAVKEIEKAKQNKKTIRFYDITDYNKLDANQKDQMNDD